jgi:hypothetical protein
MLYTGDIMRKRDKVKNWWKRTPNSFRKPFILIVGLLFVVAAGLTGWLPGPGGIPLFLIGIAILATEFEWAEKLRDLILELLKNIGHWIRQHPILGVTCTLLAGAILLGIAYFMYIYFWS